MEDIEKIKLICCDVFARMAYGIAARSDHWVDIELLPMLAHVKPDDLRRDLQEVINRACESDSYDRIILAYGLCGNATAGLTSQIPLIIPRIHDCCAMFMGSREKFLQTFGHRPSTPWRSSGYMERCTEIMADYLKLVAEYGEENAQYIWETMKAKEAVYIKLEGYEYNDTQHRYIDQLAKEGCKVEVVAGDASWFERLINGPWDKDDFLELLPGTTIEPIYDMEEIFRATEI